MIGSEFDWWNQDTPEDKCLLVLIKEVIARGSLPDSSERLTGANLCITYFGSVANAYRKVAGLLYGHGDLTSPEDLLPSERELPEDEQAKILAARRETYERKVQELKTPGTLNRWRREAAAKQFEVKVPEGCVVKQIPLKSAHEMIQQHKQTARRTDGLFQPSVSEAPVAKPSGHKQREVSAAKSPRERRPLTFQQQWEAIQESQRKSREAAQRAQAKRAQQAQTRNTQQVQQTQVNETQRAQQVEKTTGKDVKKVGGPRVTKDCALEILDRIEREVGRLPTKADIRAYATAHDQERVPHFTTFCRVLGSREEWEVQLREYQKSGDDKASAGEAAAEEPRKVEVPPKVEEPRKVAMKINVTGLMLKFQMGGQDYEVEISFGAAD